MRNYISLILFSFLYISTVFAQPNNSYIDNVMMPPPDAASLGKYGDIPVSYYTGVPNIDVPIHTVAVGPLSMPVSLSYHAGGVKVGEPASKIGLGWSLQAGGMISRTVQGLKDEDQYGYYYIGSTIPGLAPGQTEQDTCDYYDYIYEVGNGEKDSEPDIFSINMPGGSGKFYINQNQEVVLIPKQDIDVKPYFSSSFHDATHLIGFRVTTPDGTVYLFGDTGDGSPAIEYTQSYDETYPKIAAGWYLKRIETFDGEYAIKLNYEDEYYQFRFGLNNAGGCSGQGLPSAPSLITKTEAKRLNTITTEPALGTVTFYESSSVRQDLEVHGSLSYVQNAKPRALSSIKIQTGSYSKQFVFAHDYFIDNSSEAHPTYLEVNKRLRLLSVEERNMSGTIVNEPYTFEYFSKTGSPDFLPNRLTEAIDHWGYYNGVDQNNDGSSINIPYTEGTYTNGGDCLNYTEAYPGTSDRESYEDPMKYGTLKKITYPTGGHTAFEFEANDYYGTVSTTNLLVKLERPDPCSNSIFDYDSGQSFTQSELDDSECVLTYEYLSYCGCANQPEIQVEAWLSGTWGNAGYSPVATTAMITANCTANGPQTWPSTGQPNSLDDVFGGLLQAGVHYEFVIVGDNLDGDFIATHTSQQTGNKKVGGLRVQQITSHDGVSTGNDVIRTYEYRKSSIPAHSSAKLYNQPRYWYGLTSYPQSGSSCGSSDTGCPDWPGNPTGGGDVYFFDHSIVPLGSFEGYHIGYSEVKELFNGEGHKRYVYTDESASCPPGGCNKYPVAPEPARIVAGNLSVTRTLNSSNTEIAKEENFPYTSDSYEYSTGNIYKIGSISTGCGSTSNLVNKYSLRTRPYRLEKVESTLDNVKTTTEYTYDSNGDHLFPMSEKVTNSDGKVHLTEYSYVFDYPNNNLSDSLVAYNMIANPWKTDIKVNGTQVNGSEIEYAFFSSTGSYQTAPSQFPRLYKFYNYEKTWNSSGTLIGPGKTLKATINDYDSNGNPETFTKDGWSAETYTWLNGRIKTRQFEDYTWTYDYYSGTQLLSKVTSIDGQFTEFEYDDLMRLKKRKGRKSGSIYNVQTEYTYNIGGTTATNYVKVKEIFTPVSGSSLTERATWQYFDGLGRLSETVEQKKTPDQKDILNKVIYDNQGRVSKQYVPYTSPHSTGQYHDLGWSLSIYEHTLTEYEPSPLGRADEVTPPDWHATTTTFGSNTTNEVKKDGTTSYYNANELSKTTVTDPNGNKTTAFTDKLGRLILTRKEDSSGGNDTDTYNIYDDKSRITTVLPPDATLSTPGLLFEYTYDERDRMTTKKVPDAATMTYWYNNRDLMIFMQDGNLLANNQRLCTYHDDYGRPRKTGFVSHSSPPSGNDPQPGSSDILTETTYGTSGIEEGKVTYTKTKELGTTNFLDTYFYYDSYGRLDYNRGDNHLYSNTSAERTDFTYDFADNILTENRDHKINSSFTNTIDETFTYDHWGRRINHNHRINSGTDVRISNSVYDWRSRLKQKNLHLTSTGNYLQNIDYTYNDQDWLTSINNFQCMGGGGGSGSGSSSASAPEGNGFDVEVGFDPDGFGGDMTSGGTRFKVKVSGSVGTFDSGPMEDISIEKVYGTERKPDGSTFAAPQQTDYAALATPKTISYSLADTKVTYANMADVLLKVEEDLLARFEDQGLVDYGSLLANQVQHLLEDAWTPISQAGFRIAEEEAIGGGMAAAGSGSSDDLFALKLYYDVSNSTLNADAQYNGNIAYMGWQVGCNDPAYYGMEYDHLDRLKKAYYAEQDKTSLAYINLNRNTLYWVNYDERGNIRNLRRRGLHYGSTYGYIDFLLYSYVSNTNTLYRVYESTNTYYKTKGFKSNNGSYQYYTHDANGNQTSDGHRGISDIDYNHLNLPEKVTWSNGDWVEWTYDANGTKLKKVTSAGSTRHYINGVEYNGGTIDAIYHTEGRAKNAGIIRYEYTMQDHLGNSRVTFADLNSDNTVDETEILQENHYYPFGMNIEGSWSAGTNKYQYNGKELNTDFGLDWNDYGARWYDAGLGRWTSIDPLATQYYSISPYCYTANNPVRFIDPDGMRIGEGKNIFNKFSRQVDRKERSANRRARKFRRKAGKATGNKAKELSGLADQAEAEAANYNAVAQELEALDKSDQVYNLYTKSSDVSEGAGGNVKYDPATDAVNINVKGGYNAGAFAHELKHAYQFETGKLSFGIGGEGGGGIYDIQDEVEAYERGAMFGWPSNPSAEEISKMSNYAGIADRKTQLTLSTPRVARIPNSATYGQQMGAQNKRDKKANRPIQHYYKDWKKE
ncbi:MAG: RHS repeat-associated core domain-containing protein [Bacteroidota bacterium]